MLLFHFSLPPCPYPVQEGAVLCLLGGYRGGLAAAEPLNSPPPCGREWVLQPEQGIGPVELGLAPPPCLLSSSLISSFHVSLQGHYHP